MCHCQGNSDGGLHFDEDFFVLNEKMDRSACAFRVIASHQGWVRAPFESYDYQMGVPYAIVPKGIQKNCAKWIDVKKKGVWTVLASTGEREDPLVGVRMDWQLPSTVRLYLPALWKAVQLARMCFSLRCLCVFVSACVFVVCS